MRRLASPTLSGEEVRTRIVPGITSLSRRTRIEADEPVISRDERRFRDLVSRDPSGLLEMSFATPQVKVDMTWLYESRLSKSVSGRAIRGALVAGAEGICPFCRINAARTLDHTVPKSRHPRLSVEPLNLVPCCRDCNLDRNVGRETIGVSPYFDDWASKEVWLNATVSDLENPAVLTFAPIRHPLHTDAQWRRLSYFFEESALSQRYRLLAVDEFFVLAGDLRRSGVSNRPQLVEMTLVERLWSRVARKGPNCWEAAAYGAWLVHCRDILWSS